MDVSRVVVVAYGVLQTFVSGGERKQMRFRRLQQSIYLVKMNIMRYVDINLWLI